MCGRYVTTSAVAELAERMQVDEVRVDADADRPNYNVTPRTEVPVVAENVADSGVHTRVLDRVRWGLVPSWAKDLSIGDRQINARAESITEKPAYRRAFAKRRCLIPADGWYEWKRVDGPDGPGKQAMYMTPPDGHSLAFAGLYEFWRQGDAPTLSTCAIITAPSAGPLSEIHDRMPLLLPRSSWARWLDPAEEDPRDLLTPWDEAGGEHLELRPVSSAVNSVDNNGAELLEPVEPAPEVQTLF
jgi:putative SOS response-associated peptidase YedK